ncbi:MAG: hypothetical protein M5U34_21895 [Chloroflexi bacterium]|nr:hypothetical protein [Chloroflexota bacterium]
MLEMLNAQAFDTIVLRAQFYPSPVLDAIGQQYETVKAGGNEWLCLLFDEAAIVAGGGSRVAGCG